jgi:hypothetical protein
MPDMADDIDDTDEHDADHGNGHRAMADFLELLANAIIAVRDLALDEKIKPAELKKLAKLERRLASNQTKLAAIEAHAEQTATALEARAAELDRREAANSAREAAFETSLCEAHDSLRQYYDNLAQEDRRIRYRILSHANLLHGYNAQLQDLPDWQAIRRMVPDLPADLPAAPPAEVISENVREDWAGHRFIAGTTLTRTVRGAV